MSKNDNYSTVDHITVWLLKINDFKRFLITSLIFTVFMTAILIPVFYLRGDINELSDLAILASISIGSALFSGIIFGLVFSKLYKSQTNSLGDKLELDNMKPEEMVELKIWFHKGILPTTKRLIPKLKLYLEYLRPQIEGKQLFSSPKIMNIFIFLAIFNGFRFSLDIISGDGDAFSIFSLILALVFLILLLSYKMKGGSAIMRILNKSACDKFAKRESELTNL
jgi:hypothetical protein